MDQNSPQNAPNPDDPAKRLVDVFKRSTVAVLAICAVTFAVVVCGLAILYPSHVSAPGPRFFCSLLLAFLFAVFVFALYPIKQSIDLKSFNVPFVLIGPGALWIALLLLFLKLMPEEDSIHYFRFKDSVHFSAQTTWITGWGRGVKPKEYNFVLKPKESNDINDLEGILIRAQSGSDKYTVTLGVGDDPYASAHGQLYTATLDLRGDEVTVIPKE